MVMQDVTGSRIQEPLTHTQKPKGKGEVPENIETISVADELAKVFDLVPDNPLLHFIHANPKWAGLHMDVLGELNQELVAAAKGGFLKNKKSAVKKALSKHIGAKWRFDTNDVKLVLVAFKQRNLREHIHNPALRAVIANRGLALTGRRVRQLNRAETF